MLALFETHAGGDRANRICQGLGFENSFRVDAVGQSGGLWLLWRTGVGTVTIVATSDQFIHATVTNGTEKIHVIAVYAAPSLCPEAKGDPSKRPFGFEAAWLHPPGFKDLLSTSWNNELATPEALQMLQSKLKKWNREIFGDVNKRKFHLLEELKVVQDMLNSTQTDDLISKEEQLSPELDVVLEQEEMIWFQKSREKWIVVGDRNTTYFHTSTIVRRRRNHIEMLKKDDGVWVSDSSEFETLAVGYYKKLYSMEDVDQGGEPLPQEMVGDSAIRFVYNFFQSNELPCGANEALLVLIENVERPERIMQFRPISLCNVLFKVITKVMVLRLKKLMNKLIGPAQTSFILGRLGHDNIVVVQEDVHSMRHKKGRKGWMLLKLDLEKAYDRIRWDFLEETLRVAGLPARDRTEPFKAERGLRQGDPLSPYLFVLCLERLCHQIEFSVASKAWKPITIACGGPKLSHVCFADDLILFAEASFGQIRDIRKVLEQFCLASGQKVSLEKSKIFFSDNVGRELATMISEESGIKATGDLGKYLGTFLEFGRKSALTKVVLTSIPVHSMSTIALPASTLDRLDQISRSFLWGSTYAKKKATASGMASGLSWVVGDGRDIKFWSDQWMMGEPLIGLSTGQLPGDAMRLMLGALVVDSITSAKDRISWGECSDGLFTVRSAYDLLTRDPAPKQNMRRCLPLSDYNKLERHRRHLSDTAVYSVCNQGYETILHALRDCPAIAEDEIDGTPWATRFAMCVWWGWKWRCGNVFDSCGKCRDQVLFIKNIAREVYVAHVTTRRNQVVVREERLIKWLRPSAGWIKLNTDGASRGNPGLATAGGLLRDEDGQWCGGFVLNIGICSAPLAGLWGVYYGLYIAWECRVTRWISELYVHFAVRFSDSQRSAEAGEVD
ncbi:PREDICTED: uncharacterized protein LOC109127232 [Camelina sativa]|uniref:Uncharacterized protein LOC109127232 n=1 Tax=Camelina sativa TaxID=90675 RepID=A0ABM1QKM6_CAMSA|nr:PREDICTED: uncharacterized protein LOC109127232 [Camelina sativa]